MAKETKYVETPLMKQYYSVKATHPDAILLFRVGDFYETFGEDAIRASGILGITLTRRANGAASYVELAGFPYHALDVYLPKLVRAGQRVAICEQLEDPKTTKSIVKRGVTELVTPGITFNDNILSHKENSFLASVYFGRRGLVGVAFLDASTGEFFAAEGNVSYVDKLIAGFSPKEVLYQRGREEDFATAFGDKHYTYRLDEWIYNEETNREKLLKQFGVASLKGYGIDSMPAAIAAAGSILYYLDFTEHRNMSHISSISRLEEDKYVWLDRYSIRNLELFASIAEDGTSLTDVIDRTVSPMGSRMLKRWISLPLKDVAAINDRLNVVSYFIGAGVEFNDDIADKLRQIGDLERIISKVAVGRANPREVVQLGHALTAIDAMISLLGGCGEPSLATLTSKLDPCVAIREKIAKTLIAEPPILLAKGGLIAQGVDSELDDLRDIASHGKEYLLKIQQREIEATGITSLKISYNNVFGYYIEVRNTHKDKVPAEWVRKQTLVGAERYITEELKEYEAKILGAQDKLIVIEQRIFTNLIAELQCYVSMIQRNASVVACVDCMLSFARLAMGGGEYSRPEISDSKVLNIKAGRHPVIESRLPVGEVYIPNDVYLDADTQQIIMITGPNMAGKSALLRQTALIVLMAQIGSYVPASAASVGVVDKIFTRVGASDNISQGESTFMVEMLESSNILNNISDRSLVLLDEIGRGTSTYDGISIAWAMVEYLHQHPKSRAKCLFATHYHELNEMTEHFERIKNFNVSVREVNKRVIFLRKLTPGGTEHSFGIHVAKMAGMPTEVVARAEDILKTLESRRGEMSSDKPKAESKGGDQPMQLSFFQLDDPVLKQIRAEIKGLDINNLTPIEALMKLNEIKKISGI